MRKSRVNEEQIVSVLFAFTWEVNISCNKRPRRSIPESRRLVY